MALTKNEIKRLCSLGDAKFRRKEGIFVVEGIKSVAELLRSKRFEIECIYHLPIWQPKIKLTNSLEVTESELKKISFLSNPQQVLAVAKMPEISPALNLSSGLILVLDGIRDPGNLGTILRTADWFGFNQIFLGPDCADIYSPKVVQASMGSLFRISCRVEDLTTILDKLSLAGFELCATDMNGEPVINHRFSPKTALILGSEGSGLSEISSEKAKKKLSVKRYGEAESLNVGVACGIFCQLFRTQFPISV